MNEKIRSEFRILVPTLDHAAALATELVRLKVDVIVTRGPSATRAVNEASATIPIVMEFDCDRRRILAMG